MYAHYLHVAVSFIIKLENALKCVGNFLQSSLKMTVKNTISHPNLIEYKPQYILLYQAIVMKQSWFQKRVGSFRSLDFDLNNYILTSDNIHVCFRHRSL